MPDIDPTDPARSPDRNGFDGDTVAAEPGAGHPAPDPAIPPDNGRRASFDPATGEVHGSGSGAGGGNPGEDFDSDPMTGDGYPITGGEGRTGARSEEFRPAGKP